MIGKSRNPMFQQVSTPDFYCLVEGTGSELSGYEIVEFQVLTR
jgi:hypothetical protein